MLPGRVIERVIYRESGQFGDGSEKERDKNDASKGFSHSFIGQFERNYRYS
jgi:hypothetical protein